MPTRLQRSGVSLLIGTMKGFFILRGGTARRSWKLDEPQFFGAVIEHTIQDPRNPACLMMGARTGHMGPTVYRSFDYGCTWQEAEKPPAFRKAKKKEKGQAVEAVFQMTPGHADFPDDWWATTIPFGIFRSRDGGHTWKGLKGFNESKSLKKWGGGGFPPPGGPFTHSLLIDPRDAQHMYVALSVAGMFETTDGGKKWSPVNEGSKACFLPNPDVKFGQDPHCAIMHPADPDRLYQQSHCGVYRMDRPEGVWKRIGLRMPKSVGDIGFAIVPHPRDKDTVWVFPMDGTDVWPRTSPKAKPAAYVTRDGGRTWQRQDNGLPGRHAYFTVLRHAMATDSEPKAGVYFGTTSGEVYGSRDEGKTWSCLARHLPRILSIEVMAQS